MALSDDVFDHKPDPQNPGWHFWNIKDPTIFNGAVMGKLITRVEDGKCRLRMFPERKHENLQGVIHGGTTLSLIDIALFTTMHTVGSGNAGPSVTVELSTQFTGAGDPKRHLDAIAEIVRETGSLVFIRGTVEQDTQSVAAFSGIVRKFRPK